MQALKEDIREVISRAVI